MLHNPKIKEECGIFGISNIKEAAQFVALGLHALQHRGQEGCGIASMDKGVFHLERRGGKVSENFTKQKVLNDLLGDYSIGHNRYSTSGDTSKRNLQPFFADLHGLGISIAHNGNISNASKIKSALVEKGSIFSTTSDSEVVLHLIGRSREKVLIDRIAKSVAKLEGGYAILFMAKDLLAACRDLNGIRTLVIGKLGKSYVFASETCALDIIGAKYVRDVENGEFVYVEEGKLKSMRIHKKIPTRPCAFEYIYFSRPDSLINGVSFGEYRSRMGRQLAKESDVDADLVVPVPDSGVASAIGYSEYSEKKFAFGLIRNHYVGRTFIEPKIEIRDLGVRLKFNTNNGILKGKKIILVDDSIVRGTTCKRIVRMLMKAGAKEVHVRIACPEIKYPDFYGVDIPDKKELISAKKNVEQVRKLIGANSLAFLSVDGLYTSLGFEKRNQKTPQLTDHYFTGDYPVAISGAGNMKDMPPSFLKNLQHE